MKSEALAKSLDEPALASAARTCHKRCMQSEYVRDDSDLEALALSMAWAFGDTVPGALKWLQAGRRHVRVFRASSGVQAGLREIPMGQWFGGKSVPCLGIAGVSVTPEARGKGLARQLMIDSLLEARSSGLPLSSLYPASLTLYRRVGYELAGSRFRYTVAAKDLPRCASSLRVTPLESTETGEVDELYRRGACETPGYLDRCDYIWDRIRSPGGEAARGFGVLGEEGLAGYIYVAPQRTGRPSHDLALTDFVATTPEVAARVLGLLAEHRSTVDKVTWCAGPVDARVFAFPERCYRVELTDHWMLRIVHVEQALALRGYAPVSLSLVLQVQDDTLPVNSGCYRFTLAAGRPAVEQCSDSAQVRLSAGALAALYSGFTSAAQLQRAGLLVADADARMLLDVAFSGAAPGMGDYF